MTFRRSLAAALVATTMVGGVAYAAEKAAQPAATQETPAQKAADQAFGKVSKDGAQAFRDMHLARLAIFDANPDQAKDAINKAKAALTKAKADEAVFSKAEADLKTPADMASSNAAGGTADKAAGSSKSASGDKITWLPIEAQLTLGEGFQATPEKAAAVNEANKNLAKGDKAAAIEKLKLAAIDVNVTTAVLPLDKTTADVDQSATLIGQGKYYEANALLKQAEDRMRFDMVNVVAVPKAGAPTAKAPSHTGSTTQDAKPAK
ncbi:YfdX family protein [Methylobacterium oryzisoli]|uniref:YfdX family protein n=1 Tax=Methylobacterium oryzisoli TaxID=3385502 RepID=UPI0038914636